MKLQRLFVGCFAIAGLLTSCLSEPELQPQNGEGGIPINVEGAVDQASTRVSAEGFEHQDALGLYAVNYENQNQTPGVLKVEGNQADHVKYIFDDDNYKWVPVRKVYYKDVETNADLYCYYPFFKPDNVEAYNFEVRRDQSTAAIGQSLSGYEASDFLWAKAENVVPSEAKVPVAFTHRMSGAWVILEEGTGFAEGEFALLDKHVMVQGVTRKSEINMSTGIVTPVGEPQATGTVMAPQQDGSFRAVVVPQTVAVGQKWFSITVGTKEYKYGKDQEFVYAPNQLNKFTIRISKKSNTGEYELQMDEPQIVDWVQDNSINEETARQYYCVTVEEPGTLGKLIKADKKNPDKIRNLKVSGKINHEDFYFMRDSMEILEAVNLKEVKVSQAMVRDSYYDYDENGNYVEFPPTYADDIIPSSAFYEKKTLYHFAFPEKITEIGYAAFSGSQISGALVIPDDVKYIRDNAFSGTNISSVTFSNVLERIEDSAFSSCSSLSGSLILPESLLYIGGSAFSSCSFKGYLRLPNNLEYLGGQAFNAAGNFVGGLRIPDKITKLDSWTFDACGFNGQLDLNNVTEYGDNYVFSGCDFTGELIIPEGTTEIKYMSFNGNDFSSIKFPSTLKKIGSSAFGYNWRICTPIVLPEGLVSIESSAFNGCRGITALELPSTLQTIQQYAFGDCNGITKLVCHASEPPAVLEGAFNGVPKDNFTLEVPERSVVRYQTDAEWSKFRRIAAHHDFSLSRNMARALNAQSTKKYILRAPANQKWSVESKPDWITVTPSSGVGKQNVEVTFNEMTPAEVGTFERDTTSWPGTVEDKGRVGQVTFLLDGKDYRTSLDVQQYDYEHADGEVITLQKATKGAGVNIVFMADCYDALDVSRGFYMADIQEAYGYYFDIEPYKTYKDYFNVYAVIGVSDDSGIGTVNTVKDAKFGSQYSLEGIAPDLKTCFEYAHKADAVNGTPLNMSQTLIVMVENSEMYGGICYMWGDGSAVAICPKSRDAYPYDFRGIVQHEAGGHGFGKLADEYIYHNAFISTCKCNCCEHVKEFMDCKMLGWYPNLELTGDMKEVGWSHLIFHPKYSNVVDIYEGGFFHTRGVFRSEPVSCMNNNIPYYSAISRQAMVERIMNYAGEQFTIEKFIANDVPGMQQMKVMAAPYRETKDVNFYPDAKTHRPVYMGEHPEF